MPVIRLHDPAAYLSDIRSMRMRTRANGHRFTCTPVQVIHKTQSVILYLNEADQTHSFQTSPQVSPGLLGYQASRYNFIFNIPALLPHISLKNRITLPSDGTFESLGYPGELPAINQASLEQSLRALSYDFSSEFFGPTQRSGLGRLTIAVQEAIRRLAVAEKVARVIGQARTIHLFKNDLNTGASLM